MAIRVRNLTHIYNEGLPDETVALSDVSFDAEDGELLALIGHTGSGKSTLLEAMAALLGMNPEGGSKNFRFSTMPTHSLLHEELRAIRADVSYRNAFFFRAESFYNVASEVDRLGPDLLKSYGGVSLHQQSHGESFMALFNHRLKSRGLYIFDEPEAALSYINQLRFLIWMKEAVVAGSQIIIATHSPVILAYPDADILVVEDGKLKSTSYEDCYIYRDMKSFILNKDGIVKEILNEE
jgi:predicted ATPase